MRVRAKYAIAWPTLSAPANCMPLMFGSAVTEMTTIPTATTATPNQSARSTALVRVKATLRSKALRPPLRASGTGNDAAVWLGQMSGRNQDGGIGRKLLDHPPARLDSERGIVVGA